MGRRREFKEFREVRELKEFKEREGKGGGNKFANRRLQIQRSTNCFLSEAVRCGASQKRPPKDSTNSTAFGGLLLGMCRRLRLITTNYFWRK